MGAILLNILATLSLQTPQPDTSLDTSTTHGIAFERASDLLQYNRVQGLSLGIGYQLPLFARARLHGTVRYGLSDERVTGRLTFLLQARTGVVTLSGYYDIADLDPFSPGRTVGNSVNGLIAGHDNGDYALARGAAVTLETALRPGLQLVLAGRVEGLGSVSRVARSAVNDFLGGTGLFPTNPPVHEGTFGSVSAELRTRGRTGWGVTADVLGGGGGRSIGRLYGHLQRRVGAGWGVTVRLRAGAATQPAIPQSLFRLGGVNTVRGFEYGSLRAPAFWAGQVDFAPFDGRVRPVVFLDAGQAARVSRLFSSTALIGAGVGLSLFRGVLRFDLSTPVSPDGGGKVRFDLLVRAAR